MVAIKSFVITLSVYIMMALPGLTGDNQGGDLHGNRRIKGAITPQEALAYRIKGDLIFRIYLEKGGAKIGDELYLDMELINVSDQPQEVLPLDLKFTKTALKITGRDGHEVEYIGPRPRVWIPWLVRDIVSLEPTEGLGLRVDIKEFYDLKKAGTYRVTGDYNWEKWNFEGTGFALDSRQHILSNSMSFALSGGNLDLRIIGATVIATVIILGGLGAVIGLRRKG